MHNVRKAKFMGTLGRTDVDTLHQRFAFLSGYKTLKHFMFNPQHSSLRLSRNNHCVSYTVGASAQHRDLQLLLTLPSWIKIIACFSI